MKISKHDRLDKFFLIETDHLKMKVDYDDVNHIEVDAASKLLEKIITEYWDEGEYEFIYIKEVENIFYPKNIKIVNSLVNIEESEIQNKMTNIYNYIDEIQCNPIWSYTTSLNNLIDLFIQKDVDAKLVICLLTAINTVRDHISKINDLISFAKLKLKQKGLSEDQIKSILHGF